LREARKRPGINLTLWAAVDTLTYKSCVVRLPDKCP
jgi:hypothetical protein